MQILKKSVRLRFEPEFVLELEPSPHHPLTTPRSHYITISPHDQPHDNKRNTRRDH